MVDYDIKTQLDAVNKKINEETDLEKKLELQNQKLGLLNRRTKLHNKPSAAAALATPSAPMPTTTATSKTSAKEKAIRANALAIAHPDWTDDQIKAQVLQEMGQ